VVSSHRLGLNLLYSVDFRPIVPRIAGILNQYRHRESGDWRAPVS